MIYQGKSGPCYNVDQIDMPQFLNEKDNELYPAIHKYINISLGNETPNGHIKKTLPR